MADSISHPPATPKSSSQIGFPEGWLLLVGVVALGYGVAIGRLYPEGETVPHVLWTAMPVGIGVVLGFVGGVIFARARGLAAIGAAMFAGVWTFSSELASYSGSIPAKDQGGLGLVIAVLFAITVVPLLIGAHAGAWVRREFGSGKHERS